MTTSRWLAKLVPACALVALALPGSAFGQATRTWVSGVGDDANPCSRTAPCKTFAGAISKTATAGEINVLDPGGFGGVTITKAMTIRSDRFEAGVLVSGTNAIIINTPATSKVNLSGLDIIGLGTGLDGIRILQAGTVRVRDTEIYEFAGNGINVFNSNTGPHVMISNVNIHNNTTNGVLVGPNGAGGNDPRVTIRNSNIDDNGNGVNANGGANKVTVGVFNSGIAGNGNGVFASGSQSILRIGGNDIHDNFNSMSAASSGQVISFGDNHIAGNTNNNPPSSTIARTKRLPKRAR
jgi:hypothetical protein